MSGTKAVLDSNIFIYQLFGKSKVEEYFVDFEPVLSFVTEIEVMSGYDLQSKDFFGIEGLDFIYHDPSVS